MQTVYLDVQDAKGRRIEKIDKPSYLIGRGPANDLQLVNPEVSRQHAEVVFEDPHFVLRDRGSRGGTVVNSQRLTGAHVLTPRDRVELGGSGGVVVVYLGTQASEPRDSTAALALGELRVASTILESLRALGTGKVLDEVLALVLDSAIEISGAERGFIMLASPKQELEFMLGRRRGQVTLDRSQFDDRSQKVPSEAFTKNETLFVRDLTSLAGGHDRSQLLGIRSVLVVPLRQLAYQEGKKLKGAEGPIGVLYLDSHGQGMLEAAQTVGALEALAAQAAVTLENAQLYRQAVQKARMEHELRLAADIQQGLLPKGRVSGPFFSAAARSVPCRTIGGDFFDHARLSDAVFSFALGDVAGKGSPAALLSALVQGIITAQHETVISIANAVSHVNEALVRRELEGKFVTLFYARIDATGRLSYCNAGHNPPLLVGREGARRLEKGGPVVGLFPGMLFEDDTVQLSPGDQIVVYSDGLPEAENVAGEELGEEALEEAIRANASLEPPQLLDALFTHVAAFSGDAAQNDDRTALVLRFTPPRA